MNNFKRQQLRIALARHKSKAPKYTLTAMQRHKLEALPLEVFFSVPFLAGVFRLRYYEKGKLHVSAPIIWHCAKALWPEVKTLGDLVKKMPKGASDLVEMSGFGQGALILLAESLGAFGYLVEYNPELENRPETDEEKTAREYLISLSLV